MCRLPASKLSLVNITSCELPILLKFHRKPCCLFFSKFENNKKKSNFKNFKILKPSNIHILDNPVNFFQRDLRI
jgi:hypothetical protein